MNSFMQSLNKISNSGVSPNNVCAVNPKAGNPVNQTSSNVNVAVSKDLVAAAGFNVEAPIVNAIIGNITGTLPTKKNELNETVKCRICDCEITSKIILAHHLNGSRHRKRLKALDIISQLKTEKGIHVDNGDSQKSFRCDICNLIVNSAQQLEIHLSGGKHKKNIIKINTPDGNIKIAAEISDESHAHAPPVKKKKKQELKTFTCEVCNIVMNSQSQYDQHLTAKKHKLKMSKVFWAGKTWNQSTYRNQGSNHGYQNYHRSSSRMFDMNKRSNNYTYYNNYDHSVIGFS